MFHSEKLTVEQKIKVVREVRGLSQEALGKVIGLSGDSIGHYERNDEKYRHLKYSIEQILALKKHLGIEKAPLTDREVIVFKKRMYRWLDAMSVGRKAEAEELHDELSVIILIPYEPELTFLFFIFEAKKFIQEKNFKAAMARLDLVEEKFMKLPVNKPTNELYYHFHSTLASIDLAHGKYEEAVERYSSVVDLEADDFDKGMSIHYNIAYCYSEMGLYVRALGFIERIRRLYDHLDPNYYWVSLSCNLGLNYMRMGNIDEAIKLFEGALGDSVVIDSNEQKIIILHNLGCTYFKTNNYSRAIGYFDRVFEEIDKSHNLYLENLYYKVLCLVMTKKDDMKEKLQLGIKLSKDNELYSILFESLNKLSNIGRNECRLFIEKKTIPFLVNKKKYSVALFYCDKLKEYYIKDDRPVKANEISHIICEINDKINV